MDEISVEFSNEQVDFLLRWLQQADKHGLTVNNLVESLIVQKIENATDNVRLTQVRTNVKREIA